ncbi:asparagine synthase-related protein [Salmonirosea aquatica]|uniref:asparagine synthase (glutamine-hydrolyzing) n=1 Tax=Salmonirosea aquatica TaxID=2654236 RepID=A0A7C9F7F8_9BACT|nr:hypothetical protein [Cytophagaceae bacterium SJW1-29]
MSGIVGLIRWDGEKPAPGLIRQMAERIEHRGPDGSEFLIQGTAALGYLHLKVTPESFYEAQPLTDDAGLVLVADARIDNRTELLLTLGLGAPSEYDPIPDSRLILAAYQKWGEACLDFLIGDFAFVIWDSATQQIFCGRDHSGVRPFYYHYLPGQYFVFASEIKALWAFDAIPKELDESRVANYLCHWGQHNIYQHNTFFKEINSLPPAHCLVADQQQLRERMYWKVDPKSYQYQSEEEFLAAFKVTFLEAVRCRIRTPYAVSSFLSGGLDSSSVAAVAATLLQQEECTLATYYMDTELAETSEKEYVLPFLERYPVRHTDTLGEQDYYGNLAKIARMTDMPEMFSLTYNNFDPLLKDVNRAESRVLLTGSDGDTVVGYGTEYIYEAIKVGNWKLAAERITQAHDPRDYQKVFGSKEGKTVYYRRMIALLLGILPTMFDRTKAGWEFFKGAVFHLKIPPLFLTKVFLEKFSRKVGTPEPYSVDPTLPGKCVPFMKEGKALHPTTNLLINRGMLYQMMSEVSEYYDIIGAHHQVQIVHPFFDKRLIELCMFIPSKLKFYEGYGRGPLREAMRDFLPQKILRRKGKIDFTPFMDKQLADQQPEPDSVIEAHRSLLEGFVVDNPNSGIPTAPAPAKYSRLHHRILYFLHWRKAQGI